jgi:hypothetical protein
MARKKRVRRKLRPFTFPPDIFWISPDGKFKSVVGHMTAIQAHPERYGLHVSPERGDMDEVFGHLFGQGWVRGRYSDGIFSFQMERPRGTPMGNAFDMVFLFEDHAQEVEVDFWEPAYKHMAKSMSAKEFMAQKFPARWGLGCVDSEMEW